jgi:F0F1-type ATP synthase delta subunit
MARKLSRRSLALHVATHLADGKPQKKIVQQLAAYLITSRRTSELNLIVRDIQFYLADQGHIAGMVTSAHDLSAATLKEIEAFTKDKTGAKQVSLEKSIDESVLGGIKLELPGYELDTTVARKLNVLKTRYRKA